MYAEADFVAISALQHMLFCPKQAALIHVEGLWVENRLTVAGGHLHEKAHSGKAEPVRCVDGVTVDVARAVPVHSFKLGLVGVADVVEFHHPGGRGAKGDMQPIPFPVEYKRGRPKSHDADRVQLCAQAVCLEEMLKVRVPAGALFYGQPRRREQVEFDDRLRQLTAETAARVHEMIATGATPKAVYDKKCRNCSMIELCQPTATGKRRSAQRYVRAAFSNLRSETQQELI